MSDYVDRGVGDRAGMGRLTRLWAPYRSAYTTSLPGGAGSTVDPFVDAPRHSDEDSLIVARGERVYCLLNLYPYNAGHMMVVPYRKVADLEDLSGAELGEMMRFAQRAVRVLKLIDRPEGINIGLNLGFASGGSVGDHLHLHIVPRWPGDANFMTVISGTKVMPTLLRATRDAIAQAWHDLDEGRSDEGGSDA